MVVSLNYCSQNGRNLYRAPYYNGNPNIGPRIIGNFDQSPNGYVGILQGLLDSHKFPLMFVQGGSLDNSNCGLPKCMFDDI